MGQQVCGAEEIKIEDPQALSYGVDDRETGITHN